MSAGTITLTNNSDAVAGAGTAFLTDLAAGDFIVANVGGIAYTLPVKSVESATALTIISKFTGPTLSGLAWFVAKREQQALIPAALGVQSAEALRLLNNDKANWQAVFSAAGDITVTLPDGTQFTGPSWQKIVTLLAASDIEAIQPLADQVRADAQQVAADKSATETAKIDAVAAKDASEAAASTASTAKTDALSAKDAAQSAAGTATSQAEASESSAARAEAAAESLDTTNFVRKDQPEAGRNALEVYSRDEVDEAIHPLALDNDLQNFKNAQTAKNSQIESRIGYALLDFGSMGLAQRKVLENPFGNASPVILYVEIFHAGLSSWITSEYIWNASNNAGYGTAAYYSEGEGIVVNTGRSALAANTGASMATKGFTTNVTAASPVRVHVWKVTA